MNGPAAPALLLPGAYVGRAEEFPQGIAEGAYVRNGAVYSSRLGFPELVQAETQLRVGPRTGSQTRTTAPPQRNVVPSVGALVTGRVLRINPRFATVEILVVGVQPTKEAFQGLIRLQDVRATERDKVHMYKCYRPGDIVRARVISLGDARSYYLTTAENELGVLFATSEAGHSLVAISWCEMACSKTRTIEYRKCAKPADPAAAAAAAGPSTG